VVKKPQSARKELRISKFLPIINSLGKWISQEAKHTLPKSQIGKAIPYAMERWVLAHNWPKVAMGSAHERE
jgi:hypothetical protein